MRISELLKQASSREESEKKYDKMLADWAKRLAPKYHALLQAKQRILDRRREMRARLRRVDAKCFPVNFE